MSPAPLVRPDVRLETEPMAPVSCESCGVTVEARKASWEQTSIQWDGVGDACFEKQISERPRGVEGTLFMGCGALRASIAAAIDRGDLTVVPEPEE